MTLLQFMGSLRKTLLSWIAVASVTSSNYSGGGSLHVAMKNGRKYRVLVEDETE